MGNCIDLQRPATWVDDEDGWGSAERKSSRRYKKQKSPLREIEGGGADGSTEIKIKISKKQLEQLLRQADSERLPLRHVLSDLVRTGSEPWEVLHHHDQERHWRPELQSIPEVPELDISR